MVNIKNRKIGLNHKPYIIAEMSGNHNQSLDYALKIVEAAAASGVDAIKLQTFKPEEMTLDVNYEDFIVQDIKSPWYGKKLYDLYKTAQTPWEWHEEIYSLGKSLGILVFSTPFSLNAVDLLENLDSPCYKIASFENGDMPLIKRVASTGKPLIISTGTANLAQLYEAVSVAKDAGCKDLILLKCTSAYPSVPKNANLMTLQNMRDLFDCEVGVSDHTFGITVPIAAVALGATVIEKHFTLSRADGGVDSSFSLEPNELAQLVRECSSAWMAKGSVCYELADEELASLKFRRSLYVVENIKSGDMFSPKNIRAIRPGYGLPIKYLDFIIGRRSKKDLVLGMPLTWEEIL